MGSQEVEIQLEVMRSPERWPFFPILPLKRFVHVDNDPHLNVIDVIPGYLRVEPDHEMPHAIVHETPAGCLPYEDLEAIVGDGWRVD